MDYPLRGKMTVLAHQGRGQEGELHVEDGEGQESDGTVQTGHLARQEEDSFQRLAQVRHRHLRQQRGRSGHQPQRPPAARSILPEANENH